MKFDKTTFPTATDVVSLSDAKDHLRVSVSEDDAMITSLITVAQDIVEKYTGTFLQRTEGTFYFDKFIDFMDLHVGPELTIAATGVKYINDDGVETTVSTSDYQVDGKGFPARLRITDTPSDVKDELNAVRVSVTAGYESTDRPQPLISAMLLIIGHLYENRQDVTRFNHFELPMASKYLMEPYRLKSFK